MENTDSTIRARCPLYCCRVCRTKTGWRHQCWCRIAGVTQPGCADCRYHDADKNLCVHPIQRKGGAACDEKIQYSL